MRSILLSLAALAIVGHATIEVARADGGYVQTNLVSSTQGAAEKYDPLMLNPWGLTYNAQKGSPFWLSNQYSSNSTVYSVLGTSSSGNLLTVGVNNLGGALPPGPTPGVGFGPTGIVSTGAPGLMLGSSDFLVGGTPGHTSAFIFANLDGSISAWGGGATTPATIQTSVMGASFTGLAIGDSGTTPLLYAADQNSPYVDIFNGKWQMTGHFTDPNLPSGYTAFNVQNLGGTLFVTFVNPNNALGGIVDEFTTSGQYIRTLISDTAGQNLQTPWGLAIAPTGWGKFGGDLLVGNNGGDNWINAYGLDGSYKGFLALNNGQPFAESELWGLTFGGGGSKDGSSNVLYFAAGGPDQTSGLFGAISVPEPSSVVLGAIALGIAAATRWRRTRRDSSVP